MKNYIDRFSKDEGITFTKYVDNLISDLNQHKLKQLAKYFNTTTDAVLNKLIDTAYLQLPKTTTNALDKLVIPDNLVDFMQLTEYLRDRYTNQNEFVFSLFSYTALTEDIKRYNLSPSSLKNWLAYHYRNVNLTIKD